MIYTIVGTVGNMDEMDGIPDDFEYLINRKPQIFRNTTRTELIKKKQVNFIAGMLIDRDEKGNRYLRNNSSLKHRTLIVLDFDKINVDAKTFKKAVHAGLAEFSYYLYPTKSHTPENPRYRLIVKPERLFIECEHKPLIREIESRIGFKTGDNANGTWSQMNGLPVGVGMTESTYRALCVVNHGEPYPINVEIIENEPEPEPAHRIQIVKSIPDELSHAIMKNYVSKEAFNLHDRANYLSALMVIVNASQTGEISIEDGKSFAEMLACGNPEWAESNINDFMRELKKTVRTDKTFMEKFDYYGEVRNLDSTLTEYAKEMGLSDWKENLIRNKREPYNLIRNIQNLDLLLVNDENLKDILIYNEFTQVVEKSKMFPWEQNYNRQLTDDDLGELKIYLSKKYGAEFGKENLFDVTLSVAKRSSYHPIKSMIEVTPWDGVKRAETMFIDYLGADDNEYMRLVAKKWLVGAISRIYTPGIKFEIVPVITGKQGAGKSTLASKLGGEFFSDDLSDMKSKDSKEFLRGSWIVELGELSAMRKSETEEIKSFLSATKDRYRPSYGRITNDYPRTCVFFATTNDTAFLKDMTGSRRFFPVPVDAQERNKDVFALDAETVHQIWAEAFTFYNAGETCYFTKEQEKLATPYRDDATEEDAMNMSIQEYLDIPLPNHWETFALSEKRNYIESVMGNMRDVKLGTNIRQRVTLKEIRSELFGIETSKETHGNADTKKVNTIMANTSGWEYTRWRENGQQIRGYERKV